MLGNGLSAQGLSHGVFHKIVALPCLSNACVRLLDEIMRWIGLWCHHQYVEKIQLTLFLHMQMVQSLFPKI